MHNTDNNRIQALLCDYIYKLHNVCSIVDKVSNVAQNQAYYNTTKEELKDQLIEACMVLQRLSLVVTADYARLLDTSKTILTGIAQTMLDTSEYIDKVAFTSAVIGQLQIALLLQCISKRLDYVPSSEIEPDEDEDNGAGPLEPVTVNPDVVEDETANSDC